MIGRLFRCDIAGQAPAARFDPIEHGKELALSAEVSRQLWQQARAAVEGPYGIDEDLAHARFLEAARRVARTPGRGERVPGRMSLVEAEEIGFAHRTAAAHVPGRDTEVLASQRRWRQYAGPDAPVDTAASSTMPAAFRSTAVQELVAASARSASAPNLSAAVLAATPHTALWQIASQRAATLYRHAHESGSGDVNEPVVGQALAEAGRGHALPDDLRHEMEQRLGISLVGVRIHTDDLAASAARTLRAEAFTVGEDIYFASGAFAPSSYAGRKLIIHELVHVVQTQQQRTAQSARGIEVSHPADPLEQEAERIATDAAGASQRATPLLASQHAAPLPASQHAAPLPALPTATPPAADARIYRQPVRGAAEPPDKPERAPARAPTSPFGQMSATEDTQCRPSDDPVDRAADIYAIAQETATKVTRSQIPAYVKARDELRAKDVVQLGSELIASFAVLHGAKAAIDELLKGVRHDTSPGGDIEHECQRANTQFDIEARAPALAKQLPQLDTAIADALTPHTFRGQEVAGQRVTLNLAATAKAGRTTALINEVERTAAMVQLVQELTQTLLHERNGLTSARLDAARARIAPWSHRPMDLAFLRLALGGLWDLLDVTGSQPALSKPSDLLQHATAQAGRTGWLGDIGDFDIDEACNNIRIGKRENGEAVVHHLKTADPETRAKLLEQIQQRGLLDALCTQVGWATIKDLHDSLASGHGELKTQLQHYFLGPRKFGPSLAKEWKHDFSMHSLVAKLGDVGTVANFGLDVATFGINSSYGNAIDANANGLTSDDDLHAGKANAYGRAIVITIASLLSGGAASAAVRGSAASVSMARAITAGAAGGSVGAVAGLAASDLYGFTSKEQPNVSSPEEYAKAALLGGALGGVFSAGSQALGNRSLAATGTKGAPAVEGQSEVAEAPAAEPVHDALAAEHPELATQASQAGIRPGSLSEAQRELLITAHRAIADGNIQGAIKIFDQLIESGVPKAVVHKLEDALAQAAGKTALSTYRDPHATLPNGARVNPSVWGGELYYGTDDIAPSTAFEHGLPARGQNNALLEHVMQRSGSAFRGTTIKISGEAANSGAMAWADDGGWVYKIDGTPSWDMNAELEGRVPLPDGRFGGNPMPGEHEHAILAGVPKERIVGAYPIGQSRGRLAAGPMVPNPNYVPPKGSP